MKHCQLQKQVDIVTSRRLVYCRLSNIIIQLSSNVDMHSTSSTGNVKQLERPTKLPLNEAERDIPIHMYTRRPTDLNPTTPSKRAPTTTPEHTEVTLVSASEKHVGFTIEFNAKEDAPKMSMNESLSEFVPATVKNKIEESTKIVEGRKAERKMKKSYGDDPDSYQVRGFIWTIIESYLNTDKLYLICS